MTAPLTNWARNVEYRPAVLVSPRSVEELRDALAGTTKAKVRGSGHSFNRIADTDGSLISLGAMPSAVEIDHGRRIARVPGGLRYGDVVREIDAAGFAVPNLASLPHISVAGAVATGTHGSGDRVSPLSGAVAAVELMTAGGELRTIRRGDDDFAGAVISLGALGVVVAVELDLVDTFRVAQTVFERVPVDAVLADLGAVTTLGYSTSIFTTWRNPDVFDQVWVKCRAGEASVLPGSLLGGTAATSPLHPLPGVSAEACTPQLGEPGPWFERLPHFLLEFTPSAGDELQSEYFVDRRDAPAALQALRGIADQIAPLLQIAETRTMAGEAQWLSPTLGADTVAFHFTWVADQRAVEALLPTVERALAPFGARPHWGKLFAMEGDELAALYPDAQRFRDLRERLDPRDVFANAFLERVGLA
ncbi:FAD-binding protein [Microbacterium terricola]|uniref:Xylitol oxidase n=1 Tax=Microbacterium terricola TaxID=344163 RepID=A0ABM8E1W1_9MICO|nr:FAD-binding protein [Microbacterium terricola]UYK40491.1 FAD-binding protein [Microbacterium terricola]BDV31785.1 xylitol oxidase [Microbacterium terricola]